MDRFDFLVIGAGIAGASAAAELAAAGSVLLVEAEGQPGYHATGRSAAMFTATYGPPAIRALTAASRDFLATPPDGFGDQPLLRPRGILLIGRADQRRSLAAALADGRHTVADLRALDADEAVRLVPALRRDYVAGAVHEPGAMDLDVHALHGGNLRRLKAHGGRLLTDAAVTALTRSGGRWRADTAAGPVAADTVVNAAGAWADAVAGLAGARPIGLVPKRRTALVFDADPPVAPESWPMVIDVDERFYVKPESGRLLGSPADETPMPPCDVQPEELDVAVAIDRIERATTLKVRRVTHRWAGLRSFVADKSPVVGWDDAADGFFWLAGQGGYGIQTAPALARVAAGLASGKGLPHDIAERGVTEAALSPRRLSVPPGDRRCN